MPWIVLLLLFWQPVTEAAVTAKQCQKVSPKIERIQRKMRQGYGVKQGIQLNKKLRQLHKLRYQCMKKRLSINPKTP